MARHLRLATVVALVALGHALAAAGPLGGKPAATAGPARDFAFLDPLGDYARNYFRPQLENLRADLDFVLPPTAFPSEGLSRDLLIEVLVRGTFASIGYGPGSGNFDFGTKLGDLRRAVSGFDRRPNLDRKARAAQRSANLRRLARLFVDLGPGYEKLGQFLATRPDLLSARFRRALIPLFEGGEPIPERDVRAILFRAVGLDAAKAPVPRALAQRYGNLAKAFGGAKAPPKPAAETAFQAFLDDAKIELAGVGSTGMAIRIAPRSGPPLVAKIIKPGVVDRLRQNFDTILATLKDEHAVALGSLVRSVRAQSLRETDPPFEARAIERASSLLAPYGIAVPRPLLEGVTDEVLFLELAPGKSASRAKLPVSERPFYANKIFGGEVQTVITGQVHGDPHDGNVFIDRRGKTVSFIDWGLTTRLSQRRQGELLGILTAAQFGFADQLEDALWQWRGRRTSRDSVHALVAEELARPGSAIERAQRLVLRLQLAGGALPTSIVTTMKGLAEAEGVALKLDPKFDAVTAVFGALQKAPQPLVRAEPRRLSDLWIGDAFSFHEQVVRDTEKNLVRIARTADLGPGPRGGSYWPLDSLRQHRSNLEGLRDPSLPATHPWNATIDRLDARERAVALEVALVEREWVIHEYSEHGLTRELAKFVAERDAEVSSLLAEAGGKELLREVLHSDRFRTTVATLRRRADRRLDETLRLAKNDEVYGAKVRLARDLNLAASVSADLPALRDSARLFNRIRSREGEAFGSTTHLTSKDRAAARSLRDTVRGVVRAGAEHQGPVRTAP